MYRSSWGWTLGCLKHVEDTIIKYKMNVKSVYFVGSYYIWNYICCRHHFNPVWTWCPSRLFFDLFRGTSKRPWREADLSPLAVLYVQNNKSYTSTPSHDVMTYTVRTLTVETTMSDYFGTTYCYAVISIVLLSIQGPRDQVCDKKFRHERSATLFIGCSAI